MSPASARARLLDGTFPEVVRERAALHPSRPFHVQVGGAALTYGDMHALVERWAGRLRAEGVEPGDRVALLLAPGAEELAAFLALGWLHAPAVAINPAFRGELLRHALDVGAVRLALTDAQTTAAVREVAPGLERVAGTLRGAPLDLTHAAPPAGREIATILFTSGTSGAPKGVLVPWDQLRATAEALAPAEWLGDDEAVYAPYGPFHVSGRAPLLAMALRGGRIVSRPSFKTSAFWDDVERHRCTIALLVGTTVEFLLRQPPRTGEDATPLRVANLLPGGAPARAFAQRFGVRVRTSFNMTELSCPIVTGADGIGDGDACGHVREGYECRLVDRFDREVPRGEAGELIVRAARPSMLMAGYANDPRATNAAWRNGWFHTGDLLRQDADGAYTYLQRRADTIRRRGENVSAALVESRLAAHPAVAEAAVVGVDSELGEQEVFAWLVLASTAADAGAGAVLPALAAALARELPAFMVPRFWRVTDALPKTPTAKVRRAELRETAFDGDVWDRTQPAP